MTQDVELESVDQEARTQRVKTPNEKKMRWVMKLCLGVPMALCVIALLCLVSYFIYFLIKTLAN